MTGNTKQYSHSTKGWKIFKRVIAPAVGQLSFFLSAIYLYINHPDIALPILGAILGAVLFLASMVDIDRKDE